jgi:hypothetical protein
MFPGLPHVEETKPGGPPDDLPPAPAGFQGRWLKLLTSASRACCCPARPAVVVLMPATPGRPHRTDLLLCRHHYRVSQKALTEAGALVLDPDDRPDVTRAWPWQGCWAGS